VAAAPGGGATVSVKLTGASLPSQQTTTDSSGNYTMTVPEGVYYLCASQTGYLISADSVSNASGNQTINFTLTAGRNIPQMDQLLFAMYGTSLSANGATTNPWPLEHPKGRTASIIGTPTLATVDSLQWESNRYASGDGYTIGQYSAVIPVTGLTATAVIQPQGDGVNGGNWTSIIDVMYSRFILGIRGTDGVLRVNRNGAWTNGQKTILTAVVQPDGTYVVYANGVQVLANTTPSPFTAFIPIQNGAQDWRSYVNLGRNNGDGWATFNGNIGDVFVYKTALTPSERKQLEADVASKFGITLPVLHTITASAGPNGSISPNGAVEVVEGQDPTFTITPAANHAVQDVLVDDVSVGAVTSYTFYGVTAAHTIAASFIGTGGNSYADWAAANAPGQSPGEDYNNDGVDNGVAYFMGATGIATNPGLDGTNTVTWPVSATFSGDYEVQTSPDLGTWTNYTPKPAPSGGNLTFTLPSNLGKQFVRLLVIPN